MIAVTAAEREAIARSALAEITAAGTFGDFLTETDEGQGVYTLLFAATMGGYPGWHWTVSVAELPDAAPTVLEAELMPGDGSLLAPEWVPWSERLAAGEDIEILADADDLDDDVDDLDDDLDDDHGDDPDDGIDFESSDLLALSEDEQDEPEGQTDDDGPEPPLAAPVKKRRQKNKKTDEGDQPED
ncbi:MAG: DUF3027 domain-containing protein [Rhodoglobus sp.]